MQDPETRQRFPRIAAIDIARGVALVAMAVYHFTWDLENFGYLPPGLTEHGGWRLFARAIASSFLFLVGVSLFLANGNGIRWPSVWRRFAMIVAGALAITVVTWFATPAGFIFFGILHEIALASLIGLAFLKLPAPVTLAAAAGVIALPLFYRSEVFDPAPLLWIGLSASVPHSNDYVPVFPWFGVVLAGIGLTKLAARLGLLDRLARLHPGRWASPLRFAGRHSLAVYLLHQPVLFGSVFLVAQVFPMPRETPEVRFRQACEAQCTASRDEEFCARYCVCVLDRVEGQHRLADLFRNGKDEATRGWLQGLARQCSEAVDEALPDEKGGGE